MPQKSLLKYSVFKPLDLASMTNLALLGDTTERALDIRDIYFDYLTYLVRQNSRLSTGPF